MSADNYLYAWQLPDGRYAVEDRSASAYYRDEGHTVETLQAMEPGYEVDESWLADGRPWKTFSTLGECLAFVDHEERESYYEYGVSFGPGMEWHRAPLPQGERATKEQAEDRGVPGDGPQP